MQPRLSPQSQVMPPIIIDIEASGFGDQSYPIEVGFVNAAGEKYCSLIKPLAHWQHWSAEAESLHGISRDILMLHGHDPVDVCTQLNLKLNGETVYSDGWVVDYPWLIKLYYAAGMDMTFRLSPLEMILREHQMAVWHQIKSYLSANQNMVRHRASSDAELIQQVFIQSASPAISAQLGDERAIAR